MKRNELKDGRTYRLTRDVVNPELDKRERYDVAKLAWSKGDTFRALERGEFGTASGDRWDLKAGYIKATPRAACRSVDNYHEGYDALIDALEELPETAEDIMARHTENHETVLDRLLADGVITLAQVEAACIANVKEWQEKKWVI